MGPWEHGPRSIYTVGFEAFEKHDVALAALVADANCKS